MPTHPPLSRRDRRLLWSALAVLVVLGAVLILGITAAIFGRAYLLTAPLGALLILLLWRAESWLMAWHRHLQRRNTGGIWRR